MSEIDSLLLGEFAVNFGYLSRERAAEYVRLHEEGDERSLADFLLEKDHCTEGQLAELLALQGQEIPAARQGKDGLDEDSIQDKLARMKRHARKGEVGKALQIQKELAGHEQAARLGEILVSKSEASAAQIAEDLAMVGLTIRVCHGCCEQYTVEVEKQDRGCPACGMPLEMPSGLLLAEDDEEPS